MSTVDKLPEYYAPEILTGNEYSYSADWWNVGILIYEMMFGNSPFLGDNIEIIYQMILTQQVQFPTEAPHDAVDLISKLLAKDPKTRLGSGPTGSLEIIKHPFFKGISWDDLLAQMIPMEYIPNPITSADI